MSLLLDTSVRVHRKRFPVCGLVVQWKGFTRLAAAPSATLSHTAPGCAVTATQTVTVVFKVTSPQGVLWWFSRTGIHQVGRCLTGPEPSLSCTSFPMHPHCLCRGRRERVSSGHYCL